MEINKEELKDKIENVRKQAIIYLKEKEGD